MFFKRLWQTALGIVGLGVFVGFVYLMIYISTLSYINDIRLFVGNYILVPITGLIILIILTMYFSEFVKWQFIEPYRAWKEKRRNLDV